MNETQMQEYFAAHAVDGALPDEEMVKLLTGTADEAIGGETGDTDGDAPTPAETETTEETPKEEAQAEAQQPEPEPEPVIMAKDGKNTIPYSELVDAREAAQNERSRREELERRLAELEARIQGGTAQAAEDGAEEDVEEEQDDPLAALREDWPEVADALAKVTAAQQQQIAALNGQMAPIQQSEAERMRVRHYASILEAHPDADAMFESQSFIQWLDAQPSFVRDVQEAVLQRGTASQVIELFDDFKRSTGWGKDAATDDNAAQTQQNKQTAVRQAQQQAKAGTPKSLSDIPGGAAVQTDPTEAFIAMSETARMDKIMGMSPEQIENMLRRAT